MDVIQLREQSGSFCLRVLGRSLERLLELGKLGRYLAPLEVPALLFGIAWCHPDLRGSLEHRHSVQQRGALVAELLLLRLKCSQFR